MKVYSPEISDLLSQTHEVRKIYLIDIREELTAVKMLLSTYDIYLYDIELLSYVMQCVTEKDVLSTTNILDDVLYDVYEDTRVYIALPDDVYNNIYVLVERLHTSLYEKVYDILREADAKLVCNAEPSSKVLHLQPVNELGIVLCVLYEPRK